MIIHEIIVREHNKRVHGDIDQDILRKMNGLFTFVVRINNGNIVDYTALENDNYARKQV